MAYLLRTKEDYRIYYGEPVFGYVMSENRTLYSKDEYMDIIASETESERHDYLLNEYFLNDGWADVCQSDFGIVVKDDIADYILEGTKLEINSYVEIITKIKTVSMGTNAPWDKV